MDNRLVPLASSNEILRALLRLGCTEGKRQATSHRAVRRQMPDGRILSRQLVMGKRELPRGTLKSILSGLEIPLEDFLRVLR